MQECNISRNCPKCNTHLSYSCIAEKNRAEKDKKVCRSCSHKGQSVSNVTKEKISRKLMGNKHTKGYSHSIQMREKLKRRVVSELTREKLREHRLNQILKLGYKGPAYNKKACQFIDNINQCLGLTLQHAQNGGEHRVCGYSLDGYDYTHNVAFEYDELANHNSPTRKEKDFQRQERIIQKINPKMFLRYDEKHNKLYDTITNTEIPFMV